MTIQDLPPLLTPVQLASFLGVRVQTLANNRHQRINGLPYIKCGRLVRYKREDVFRWLESNTIGGIENEVTATAANASANSATTRI